MPPIRGHSHIMYNHQWEGGFGMITREHFNKYDCSFSTNTWCVGGCINIIYLIETFIHFSNKFFVHFYQGGQKVDIAPTPVPRKAVRHY